MAFVERVEKDNLQALSLDELAIRFDEIEQQGQLLQGRILLEARNRFPSDKEFGQWCATHSICVGSQQHRNRLMNLARFFGSRELDKIGISAAYEIAAPANADVAVDVYGYAKGKNLPLAEVRRQIAIRKGESYPLPEVKSNVVPIKQDVVKTEVKTEVETKAKAEVNVIEESVEPSNTEDSDVVDFILNSILKKYMAGEKLKLLKICLANSFMNIYYIKPKTNGIKFAA
jgi:hypothetical protein